MDPNPSLLVPSEVENVQEESIDHESDSSWSSESELTLEQLSHSQPSSRHQSRWKTSKPHQITVSSSSPRPPPSSPSSPSSPLAPAPFAPPTSTSSPHHRPPVPIINPPSRRRRRGGFASIGRESETSVLFARRESDYHLVVPSSEEEAPLSSPTPYSQRRRSSRAPSTALLSPTTSRGSEKMQTRMSTTKRGSVDFSVLLQSSESLPVASNAAQRKSLTGKESLSRLSSMQKLKIAQRKAPVAQPPDLPLQLQQRWGKLPDSFLFQDEVDRLREIFDSYVFPEDRGRMDRYFLRSALKDFFEHHVSEDEVFLSMIEAGIEKLPHRVLGLNEFTRIAASYKGRRARQRNEEDTMLAFVALGGGFDGSGEVKQEDFEKICQRFSLQVDVDKLFREIDLDGNGTVDCDEFAIMMSSDRDDFDSMSEADTLVVQRKSSILALQEAARHDRRGSTTSVPDLTPSSHRYGRYLSAPSPSVH